jgi:hypothetical protein
VALCAGVGAVVATVAALLAATAVLDLYWDPQAAVVQAIVAVWVVQTPVLAVLAGRRRRADRLVVAGLRAEVERKDARIAALEDHAIFHYDCRHLGRYAGDLPLLPDVGDRRDWADVNRKPEVERTAAPDRITTLP